MNEREVLEQIFLLARAGFYPKEEILEILCEGLFPGELDLVESEHQGRTVHEEKVYKDQQGNKRLIVTTIRRKKGHTSEIAVGFLDVDHVLQVEALLRRTLNLPEPSS